MLADILDAAGHVANFIAGLNVDQFRGSELVRSAVVQKLAIIGEAARHLSKDFRDRHAEIPWPQVISFRNLLIHAYFSIDWEIVWRTATVRCPQLRDQIAAIASPGDDTAG
ncbi:MAG: HepT-like ribonuclease domain-containing protein [Terriglobales bacterium]